MGSFFREAVAPHFNFWIYVVIMMIGLWAVIAKNNLIKKLIGLSIFQTAILLLYVSLGVKEGASIPILDHAAADASLEVAAPTLAAPTLAAPTLAAEDAPASRAAVRPIDPDKYANPVPHVLMLTAIVVGVATLGVGLSLCQSIHRDFGTLEEDEVLRAIKALHDDV